MNMAEVSYMPLWRRYLDQFDPEVMDFEQMGRMVYAMMRFHFLDEEPTDLPPHLKLCWSFLRKDLIFAKTAYINSTQNGKKGGRPKKTKTQNNPDITQNNPDITQNNPDITQNNPDITQNNPDITQNNPDITQSNLDITQNNLEKPITESITITESESITESISNTDTNTDSGSAPSLPEGGEGVCCEKKAFGEFGWVKLTERQHQKLMQEWGLKELQGCITYVDESAQSTHNKNRWKDWYVVLGRCHRDGWHLSNRAKQDPIPKGASGELGEAELEAIQQILRE